MTSPIVQHERIATRVDKLRHDPATIDSVKPMARAIGVTTAELDAWSRHHYHLEPADLLIRWRLDGARQRLLTSDRGVAEIAADVGFATELALRRAFARWCRLSPEDYRCLLGSLGFEITLPAWFRHDNVLSYWGRDPSSLSERITGRSMTWALSLGAQPLIAHLELGKSHARCHLSGPGAGDPGAAVEAHGVIVRLLGLHCDPRSFERRLDRGPLARLIRGRKGLTIPQTPTLFDGMVWVIAGQQVSLAAAFSIRRRLTERFGRRLSGDLVAPPTAAHLAQAEPEELATHGLTRNKARALSSLARAFGETADGVDALDEKMHGKAFDFGKLSAVTAPEAEKRLLACKGLGPWSVGYLMMRSFGFGDCVPVGDVALLRSLQRFFDLEERPKGAEQTLELMCPFVPARSLATFHFWALLKDPA